MLSAIACMCVYVCVVFWHSNISLLGYGSKNGSLATRESRASSNSPRRVAVYGARPSYTRPSTRPSARPSISPALSVRLLIIPLPAPE